MLYLPATEARTVFPQVVGDVSGAVIFADGSAIVMQGIGAYAAIVDGEYVACCPTAWHAVAAIARRQEAR